MVSGWVNADVTMVVSDAEWEGACGGPDWLTAVWSGADVAVRGNGPPLEVEVLWPTLTDSAVDRRISGDEPMASLSGPESESQGDRCEG